ncbi:TPA: hypothetical protein TVR14_001383 [Streptococcus equi subsp. zooepidemicus]|uniref:hypothetical protein n=1 Tax=Streptococcus equi TaxID=1336 RepID=UPI0005B82016|nr:hypothetical protein [Streptococcus equi]HEL0697295.1 hypothetical protein [Streptococcus equi subsp. zooepidemicus]KIS13858.1 hypothetical protein AT51_00946 [Streptococcus equi subsp. zooepidemicus Sz57]HEL0728376.1 hypothetical protein [Streptococcus equi subsp. zooepidemicus]HEL1079438.1 hypothetical protein [Streptococcus equi subsp. zooepidemicus]HEL1209928.1 hypothetical protein [Streptococcus equi subsp. zooepidemicus]
MKKLVLASAAALVLAGAVVGTGEVRAFSYWRRVENNPYSYRTETEKSLEISKQQLIEKIKTFGLSEKTVQDFERRIMSLTDASPLNEIEQEAKWAKQGLSDEEKFDLGLQNLKQEIEKISDLYRVHKRAMKNRLSDLEGLKHDIYFSGRQKMEKLQELEECVAKPSLARRQYWYRIY